ncbi:hypothetical protein FPQ18DRAFT_325443 [Pyronema domesticum]|nr:hypothetical protein FPQ18DRAFT_325443 [Pyronema domesticum]
MCSRWCLSLCCKPKGLFRCFRSSKHKKTHKSEHSDGSDNARIVSEKRHRDRSEKKTGHGHGRAERERERPGVRTEPRESREVRERSEHRHVGESGHVRSTSGVREQYGAQKKRRSHSAGREKRKKPSPVPTPTSSSTATVTGVPANSSAALVPGVLIPAPPAPTTFVPPAPSAPPVIRNIPTPPPSRPETSVASPQTPTRTRPAPIMATPPAPIKVSRPPQNAPSTPTRPAPLIEGKVMDGQILRKHSPPPQTPVITHQTVVPTRHNIITPPELAQYLVPPSTIGPLEDDTPVAQQPVTPEDTATTDLSYFPPVSPGRYVETEIFASPSGRRERSVSRVRSERSRRRSSSRPRSSYGPPRDFRDSQFSLYSDASRRGDDSDGSAPSVPPLPSPGERSMFIGGHGRRRNSRQENRIVIGTPPKSAGRDETDSSEDWISNVESMAKEALKEEMKPKRYCPVRENRARQEREEEVRREIMEAEMEREKLAQQLTPSRRASEKKKNQEGGCGRGKKAGAGKPIPQATTLLHQQPPSQLLISNHEYHPTTPPESPLFPPADGEEGGELVSYVPRQYPKLSFAYDENGPLPRTYKELREHLSTHIVSSGLDSVIPADSPDPIAIARQAEAEADRICRSLGISEYATPDLTKVALYDVIVFCDDSGSMLNDHRFDEQRGIVQRISRIAQTYNKSGVSLRFINFLEDNGYNNLKHTDINGAVSSVFPAGTTRIGTKLLEKVVLPFVVEPARRGTLRRPVLISIITDGEPTEENIDTLKWAILACKHELSKNVSPRTGQAYGKSAVTFQISRIGNSPESKRYLDRLANDPDIGDLIMCVDETLDAAVRTAGPDSGKLMTWLTKLLAGAVAAM